MTNLETIIQLHEKLIYKIATRFHDAEIEDLYQAGVIGIIKAYNNFKADGTTKFLLAQKLNHLPSIQELSSFLGYDEATIKQVYECTSSIMSLDNETERPIYETISNPKDDISTNIIDLKDSMNTLTKEEKDVINYRYFKDFTQSETAKILGMSQVKVSRYEKKSLSKMYNYLSA